MSRFSQTEIQEVMNETGMDWLQAYRHLESREMAQQQACFRALERTFTANQAWADRVSGVPPVDEYAEWAKRNPELAAAQAAAGL